MKRSIGTLAMNWLRKPENQQRIKSTARDVWGKFQARRNERAGRDETPADQKTASSQPSQNAPSRDSHDERQ